MMSRQRGATQSYAGEFAEWLRAALARGDTDALVRYRDLAPHAVRAHPTDEHFLPLFVAWGAAGERPRVERVVEGIDGGVLAMDSYLFQPSAAAASKAATTTHAAAR